MRHVNRGDIHALPPVSFWQRLLHLNSRLDAGRLRGFLAKIHALSLYRSVSRVLWIWLSPLDIKHRRLYGKIRRGKKKRNESVETKILQPRFRWEIFHELYRHLTLLYSFIYSFINVRISLFLFSLSSFL